MSKKTSLGELTSLNEMDTHSPRETCLQNNMRKINLVNSLPTGPRVRCWVRAGGGQMTVIKVN